MNDQRPLIQQQLNPDYVKGPKKANDRYCTDIICGILFFFSIWATAGILIYFSSKTDGEIKIETHSEIITSELVQSVSQVSENIKTTSYSKEVVVGTAVAFFAFGLSFLLILATPYIAECVIWTMILLNVGAFILGGVIMISNKDQGSQIAGIIFFIFGLFYLCLVYCLRNRIRKSIILIKAASYFIKENISSILISVIIFIIYIGFTALYLASIIYVSKAKDQYVINEDQQNTLFAVLFVFFLWASEVVFCYILLSYSIYVSFWFFSYNKNAYQQQNKREENIFWKSLYWPLRFHIGSISFGALMLTVIKIIRMLAEKNQQNSQQKKDNILVQILFACLACLARCIESCCEHLSKCAYIMMALTGDNFCDSAREGFNKVYQNFGTYLTLNNLADYYANFGVLLVSLCSTAFGFLLLDKYDPYNVEFWLFIGFYFIISLIISAIFMGILSLAADCCLFYMTVDKLCNNGFRNFGPPQLDEIDEISKQ